MIEVMVSSTPLLDSKPPTMCLWLVHGQDLSIVVTWAILMGGLAAWVLYNAWDPPVSLASSFIAQTGLSSDIVSFFCGFVGCGVLVRLVMFYASIRAMPPVLKLIKSTGELGTSSMRVVAGKEDVPWKEVARPWILFPLLVCLVTFAVQVPTSTLAPIICTWIIPDCLSTYSTLRAQFVFQAMLDATQLRIEEMQSLLTSKIKCDGSVRQLTDAPSADHMHMVYDKDARPKAEDAGKDFWMLMCRRHLQMRLDLEQCWNFGGALIITTVSHYSVFVMFFGFFAHLLFKVEVYTGALVFAISAAICAYASGKLLTSAARLTSKCASTSMESGSLLETVLLFNGIDMPQDARTMHAVFLEQLKLAPGGVTLPILGVVNYSLAAKVGPAVTIIPTAFAILQAHFLGAEPTCQQCCPS